VESTNPTQACGDLLCTIDDVARVLALEPRDIGHLIATGELPSIMLPGLGRRIRASAVRAYIRSLEEPVAAAGERRP